MASIAEKQQSIREDFDFFDDWSDRYRHIIDLGDELPELPKEYKIEDYIVPGCQSQVWLVAKNEGSKVFFSGDSDAAIVKGLVSLLINVYSGHEAKEIVEADFQFIHDIGLGKHLSMNRANGLSSMIKSLKERARSCIS
jgi:cysteine desulfuration protein SufE